VEILLPKGWAAPIGYANGVAASGRIVFVAGQVGWDERQQFQSADIAPQFEQALKNVLAVLAEAGGAPGHVCRMTAYCCDKPAYLRARKDLGAIWRRHMGRHYPAMSMIFVDDLLDSPGKIELEATAVVPRRRSATGSRAAAAKTGGRRRSAKSPSRRRSRAADRSRRRG
jgi:enamine deaminase RidA (YjgF/YER057c/UK114 family)